MKFEAYCDESNPEVLGSENAAKKHLLIGSVWLRTEDRSKFKDDIYQLRQKHRIGGEFKWNRISKSRQQFYFELVSFFFEQGDRLRFRCIAVDRDKVNLTRFHESDQELGFYKFYYQLLHHWILDFNEYAFFLDMKKNRRPDRLQVLRRCLDAANLSSDHRRAESRIRDVFRRLDMDATEDSEKLKVALKREIGHRAMI